MEILIVLSVLVLQLFVIFLSYRAQSAGLDLG